MKKESSIELTVREGDKSFKVLLTGEAFKDLEDMKSKLGANSTIEAVIYAIKILSSSLEGVSCGSHLVDLPNGKKVKVIIENK